MVSTACNDMICDHFGAMRTFQGIFLIDHRITSCIQITLFHTSISHCIFHEATYTHELARAVEGDNGTSVLAQLAQMSIWI